MYVCPSGSMYTQNNRGTRMEPCGTPKVRQATEEEASPNPSEWLLSRAVCLVQTLFSWRSNRTINYVKCLDCEELKSPASAVRKKIVCHFNNVLTWQRTCNNQHHSGYSIAYLTVYFLTLVQFSTFKFSLSDFFLLKSAYPLVSSPKALL